MALKDEIKQQKATKARRRPSLNGRSVLSLRDEDRDVNFHYRVVNDVGDRVAVFKEKGYEVVDDPTVKLGDYRAATSKGEGTPVTAHVGAGMKGVLMRIPKEWYQEDQRMKQDYVDELEASTRAKSAGEYGKVEIERHKR